MGFEVLFSEGFSGGRRFFDFFVRVCTARCCWLGGTYGVACFYRRWNRGFDEALCPFYPMLTVRDVLYHGISYLILLTLRRKHACISFPGCREWAPDRSICIPAL